MHALADRVLAWTGNRMEHVALTVERLRQLAQAREPIVSSWLEEAVVLHGPALDTDSPSRGERRAAQMSPKKLVTRRADPGQARARLRIAQKYLEVAELVATEDGAAVDVCVGLAVLAGVAAGDAVCIAATGERYSGQGHMSAAELLERVDAGLGKRLRLLVGLKPGSRYESRCSASTIARPRCERRKPWFAPPPNAPSVPRGNEGRRLPT
jgi:hypothetical protein